MDNNTKIETVVQYALAQVGKPYSFSAQPPNSWDCTKLTAAAWGQVGVKLTAYSYVQAKEVKILSDVSPGNNGSLQPGDLLFFFKNETHHASMYIGSNEIVEASSPETGVRVTSVWNSWNSTNFSWAGRPFGINPYTGTGIKNPGNESANDKEDENILTVSKTRKVPASSISSSTVVGTPQSGRFAVLNLANESVYLVDGTDKLKPSPEFYIKAMHIVPGDQYEINKVIDEATGTYEIIINSDIIQSKEQAEAILKMISRSISNPIKSINVQIFGNPLLQLGDIVKFNFFTDKIQSSSDQFYIISRIQQDYTNGLATSLSLRPLTQSVSVV